MKKFTMFFVAMILNLAFVFCQTNVTTTGGTTGSIPYFTGTATVVSSVAYQSSSKIGIGTASPGSMFVVANNQATPVTSFAVESPSALTGANNTFGGVGAGINVTDGTNNAYFGYKAGYSNPSADNNTCIGYYAGYYGTGDANTFFGREAGFGNSGNSTGTYNVGMGYRSLYVYTTGTGNSAFGVGAADKLSTGNYNISIGYGSMTESDDPDNNICIGNGAGAYSEGDDNIYIGQGAGTGTGSTTSGAINNIGIGYRTLYKNETGTYNTCLGLYSAGNLISSSENSLLGSYSGFNLISGGQNVNIGYKSGYTASTNSGCVFLGYKAGYYETASNKLFIDNAARASEADARLKALVYGIFDSQVANQILAFNAKVGIGTTSPGASLEVVGSSGSTLKIVDGNQGANKVLTSDANGVASWSTPNAVSWSLTGNTGTTPGTNFIGTTDAQSLVFETNATERMRILSSGNVGIGTTSPIALLHVYGQGAYFGEGGDGGVQIGFDMIGGEAGMIDGSAANLVAGFKSFGSGKRFVYGGYEEGEGIVINPANNNIGIGTSNPQKKLDVIIPYTSSINQEIRIGTDYQGYVGLALNFIMTPTQPYACIVDYFEGVKYNDIYLQLGSVGIGTTPENKLDVEGAMAIGATYSGNSSAPSNGLIVQGNVGIGTTTTVNKLDIEGAVAIGATYSGTSTAPSNGLIVEGNVGIGTTLTNNPNEYKLAVNGTIGSKEVFVESTSTTWPDYVFNYDYSLMSISELEKSIKENKKLPGVPSATDIDENGIPLGEMNTILLQKVEELTLYIIELNKKVEILEEKQTK
ncbi:MAG: hypothetical protein V1904_00580 [Bacteroidota bacterium]